MGATKNQERRYPDQILTDDKGLVSVGALHPNATIRVLGRRIKASQIPMSFFALNCGHTGKGIALKVNDVVFCEKCGVDKSVSRSRG